MMYKRTDGGFVKSLAMFVVGICVLFIVFSFLAKYLQTAVNTSNSSSNGTSFNSPNYGTKSNSLVSFLDVNPSTGGTVVNNNGTGRSAYMGSVTLSQGNSSYSAQPYEEYLMLRNSGAPVNITGWALVNGKGARPIQNSQNSYFYPTPDTAIIGQGTEFLDPSGNFTVGSIVLKSGDQAYVTTGGPFSQFPFSINTSFRENECVGYLINYPFEPGLDRSCPSVLNDKDVETVTDECYDYMQSLNRCTDPEKQDKKKFEAQTTQCQNFMKVRLNYPSCVAGNRYSSDFAKKQWRIFLGKKTELWSNKRDTITLYDAKGLIVDQISY